jgi:fermentation-respiration switch protein FrsA (DUF1100 family)
LIGHSEGGLVAAMNAAKLKAICFIVLLASPGIAGKQLLLLQQQSLAKASDLPESIIEKSKQVNATIFDMIIRSKNEDKLKADLKGYLEKAIENDSLSMPQGLTKEEFIQVQLRQLTTPWMKYFLNYEPATALKKVKCPVLALNGEKDLQVPPKQNLVAISETLKKQANKNSTIKELQGLNHLFQHCKTGLPNEYPMIDETFSPLALEEMTKWIVQIIR